MLSVAFLKNTPDLPSKMESLVEALEDVILDDPSEADLVASLWDEGDDLYCHLLGWSLRLDMGCMWAEGHWEALSEDLGFTYNFLKKVGDPDLRSALENIAALENISID